MAADLHQIGRAIGLKVYFIPNPRRFEFCGPPARRPSKAQGRRGTKRLWSSRLRPKAGWRYVAYEPPHALRTADALFVTHKQYEILKRKIRDA